MSPERTDTFFDHLQKAERPTALAMRFMRQAFERMLSFAEVARDSRILEIGPGRGEFAGICLERKLEYHAIEPNAGLAESLRSKGAHVVCARVPPLPALDRQFDLVVMINVMEHMSGLEQALDIACQVRQALKPGGKFLIHCPDYLSWRQHFFNCDFSHNYVTSRRRLDQLLVNAGYADIRSRYMSGPFVGVGAVILAAFASHLPFGALESLFPRCPVCRRLYKLQLTLSRRVLILGHNVTEATS
ncbi:MAG TPA: class I SAM-dependent methyltransferase [Sedimentisphaerales bacterium]|nr:class I SAM-dependent methyltransferase [Sedimentisphaerales bacterium]HRS12089.1 class I SAM-dependent methyltransferase [Sedimentisphaerales bacterium]HRV48687.1 class I SAM-dependent methyltransferase [Sedimentisphaerales bacterium]